MNLTTSKKDLLRIATRMSAVAERKSTMPILSNVLLRADKGRLHLAATDLYMSLIGDVPAEATASGAVAVSAKDLVERVKMMPDGPVQLTRKDSSLVLKSGGAARRYTLRAISGEDFPPLPKQDPSAATLSLPSELLAKLIGHTHFSVSTDETRAHLNSALLEWDGSVIRMVSTDGHRLSKVERTVDGKTASATMLIPLRALHEVRRIVDDLQAAQGEEREELKLTPSGASAFFAGGGLRFSVKLTAADFPPYRQVIPQASPKRLLASRVALADAVKAVSVAADQKGAVKLALSKGTLRLSSESADAGDGVDELAVDYAGPNMAIGFAAKYLLDVLGALSCDEVEIGLNEELDPIVVKPVGDVGVDFVGVVMPMRI